MRNPLLLLALIPLAGCREAAEPVPLRALERSGDVSFLCADLVGRPYDFDRCPDFDAFDGSALDTFALVTQTLRGEVAVVHLAGALGGDGVKDVDPTVPGITPLPVGANPGSIVTTPGGTASFVTSAEGPNRFGIYALPTSCVLGGVAGEEPRDSVRRISKLAPFDISTWPACSLPVAPGTMTLLFDPADDDGNLRMTCGDDYVAPDRLLNEALSDQGSRCPADLAFENWSDPSRSRRPASTGRPKLAVALPDEDRIAIIDAQALLDMPQGGFGACPEVATLSLRPLNLPSPPIQQQVPPDLESPLVPRSSSAAPPDENYSIRPSGMAVSDGVLYVGDLEAPVIHRINVADPCAPTALPPLLPLSYDQPWRVVTTNAVAASPPTSRGQRFVYAVDDIEGSLMMFDVTPGSNNRTPIVRPGAAYLPNEAPDRVQFPAPIKDVEFVFRDLPEMDPETGVAAIGTLCDPDPDIDPLSAPALYRPSESVNRGAKPHRLRGLFGFVALTSGQAAVIDVEDFDAPCRRPARTNPGSDLDLDFQGCAGDPAGIDSYTDKTGEPTVTDEVSCRVVEPHRPRSATPFLTSTEVGVHAPALRAFPRLSGPDGESLTTSSDEAGLALPRLLAAKMPGDTPAQVFLGSTLRREGEVGERESLELDPMLAENNSVMFTFREPRAFAPAETMTVRYEGVVAGELPAGYFGLIGDGPRVLEDPAGAFCSRGVEDVDLIRERAEALGIEDEAERTAFALGHADYVQITAEIPPDGDEYWAAPREGQAPSVGYECGEPDGEGFSTCLELFGTPETPTELRELRVTQAYQNQLVLEPRQPLEGIGEAEYFELLNCCFGHGLPVSYVVRAGRSWILSGSASGFRHDVVPEFDEPTGRYRCRRSVDPRRRLQRGRAYEHRTAESCGEDEDAGECLACVLDEAGPAPAESPCVFENVMLRFALYRGSEPSERDMVFTFDYSGGFLPLLADFAPVSTAVSPQTMVYVPQLQELFIADGGSLGLLGVNLDTMQPSREIF